jgi:hypothetical protein
MNDNGDDYDALEAGMGRVLLPKVMALIPACYMGLVLVYPMLWGIITAIGFIFLTGFVIARFVLNVQETRNLVLVTIFSGSSLLCVFWLLFRVL